MERHPYFDLLLHSDEELEKILGLPAGIPIRVRETLHEWPLSCVQRITAADGNRWIYKAQSGPTVEAEFYARAKSRLLVRAETVYQAGGYSCMLFECLDAPRLCDRLVSEDEVYALGRALAEAIGQISGFPPVYFDISTWVMWQAQMARMVDSLRGLVSTRVFSRVSREVIAGITLAAFSGEVQNVIEGPSGLAHHDLNGDNVFLLPDGPRIIDWQRPIRGPLDLDLATLVESFGYDPRSRLSPGLIQVLALLRIHWFTECAARWFPPGAETYDQQIVDLAGRYL